MFFFFPLPVVYFVFSLRIYLSFAKIISQFLLLSMPHLLLYLIHFLLNLLSSASSFYLCFLFLQVNLIVLFLQILIPVLLYIFLLLLFRPHSPSLQTNSCGPPRSQKRDTRVLRQAVNRRTSIWLCRISTRRKTALYFNGFATDYFPSRRSNCECPVDNRTVLAKRKLWT